MEIERRALTAPVEVRSDSRTIAGYAAVFNSVTDIGGMFREQIAPGAFQSEIGKDVLALYGHDPKLVLGRSTAGTLRMAEDGKGLSVEIDLPDTSTANDLRENMKLGNISGMSFGFRVTAQEWDESGDLPLRTIKAVELAEVSVVSIRGYPDTSIALRSLEAARTEQPECDRSGVERFLARSKMTVTIRKASANKR
jgi:hypothetical protein